MQRKGSYKATPFNRPRPSLKLARTQTFNLARRQSASPGFWSMRGSSFEKKFVDTNVNTDVTTTATITPINLLATGTDANNRVGRKIELKSVQVRSFFSLEANTINGIRCMLVYDRQPNGAAPVIGDILATASVTGLLNMDNRDRFLILYDEEIALDAGQAQCRFNKVYKKLKLETVFNSTTTATASAVASGMLLYVTIGSTAADVSDVDQNTNIRVRFIDG